jgi:hypothetical protein
MFFLCFSGAADAVKHGMGSIGKCFPTNVVINADAEAQLRQHGVAKDWEKRWYYLGVDIPSDRVVSSPLANRRQAGPVGRPTMSPLGFHGGSSPSRRSSGAMDRD